MEDPGGPYRIALAIVLLCFSAAFSASETALFSLRRIPNKPSNLWKIVRELRDYPEKTLSTILLGNTLVNVIFTSAITALTLSIATLSREEAEGTAAVASFLLLLAFGEVGPKTWGSLKPMSVLGTTALPLWYLRKALSPLTSGLTALNQCLGRIWPEAGEDTVVRAKQLVETAVGMGEKLGSVGVNTGTAIRNIMATTETPVRRVMTPRAKVQAVEITQPLREVAMLMNNTGLSRIPVYRGSLDSIVGLVHLKDILPLLLKQEDIPLDKLLRPIFIAAAADTVPEVLRALRQQGAHMSAVYNSQQKLIGVATVEDLVEEIVGEITDEHDLFKAIGGQ